MNYEATKKTGKQRDCFWATGNPNAINHQPSTINNSHSLLTTPFSLLTLFFIFFFSSCEKVITLKLSEADKKVVIEGNVPYREFPEVRISETKAFEDSNGFNGISGATVTIQMDSGKAFTLFEDSTGIYRSKQFIGNLGTTYHLAVMVNGKTYTATSTMPAQPVTLDSLWADGFTFGGTTSITIYPEYNDPPGFGNSYNLIEYKNDTLVRKVFPQDDALSDGRTVSRPLIDPDGDIKEGDFVTVELQCIDANVYKYWFSLDESATGNSQSATPTNPVTNISGGALGYFSAYSATSYSIHIP